MPKKEPFRTIENSWIVLKDGTRLGVRLWIPLSAEHMPVPVVWEYIPYRKRDLERGRDNQWANAFVPYGFAFARVTSAGPAIRTASSSMSTCCRSRTMRSR